MRAIAIGTFIAFSVHTSGRNRPVASAKPHTLPVGSATGSRATVNTVPEVPSDTATSPGLEREPQRGRHVVAGAGGDDRAAGTPDGLGRPDHVGQAARPVLLTVDDAEQVEPPLVLGRRPVAGTRRVAAVGHEAAREVERQPVVREQDVADAVEVVGLLAVQPRQLRDRERRRRDRPARPGPGLAPTELLDEPVGVGRRLGVVPQLRRSDDLTSLVEHDHAVLLRGDRHRLHAVRAGVVARLEERLPPRLRLLLAARRRRRRVRGPTRRDELAAVDVADLDLRGLRGGVHAHGERHRAMVASRRPRAAERPEGAELASERARDVAPYLTPRRSSVTSWSRRSCPQPRAASASMSTSAPRSSAIASLE